MTEDARFEDAHEAPLHLKAQSPEDLPVISALVQDAVLPITEMRWDPRRRRFALLINRFRWEEGARAHRPSAAERVQSMLVFDDVLRVASQGIDRTDTDTVLSLLSIGWEPAAEGAGRFVLTLAGDGALALDAECIEVTLRDVTRPYLAPSRRAPSHPD
jgi:hypothetical protein